MASKRNRSRKSLAVALAIVGVAGLSMASAAQISVNSQQIVAGSDTVSPCDATGLAVSYGTPAFLSTIPGYTVNTVTLTDADSDNTCSGNVTVTVTGAAGVSLGAVTAVFALVGDAQTVTLPSAVNVESIQGVSIVIG